MMPSKESYCLYFFGERSLVSPQAKKLCANDIVVQENRMPFYLSDEAKIPLRRGRVEGLFD